MLCLTAMLGWHGQASISQFDGDEHTLMVDVQHAKHPDLKDFRRGKDLAIVLDEVGGPDFIVHNKKLLQAHVDGAKLGQSATQLFAYEVFLWKIPLILTTNKWSYRHLDAADRDWIEANCVPVHITDPVWDDKPKQLSTPRSTRRPAEDTLPGPSPEHKLRRS